MDIVEDDIYMIKPPAYKKRMDEYFMKVAKLTSELSYAQRKKVGAVLTKDFRICSIGFNGTPHSHNNCCEDVLPDGSLVTKPNVIHAESNAIFWCAKSGISTQGTTLYLTMSPCQTCSLAIIQAGIKRVVYGEKYRDDKGIEYLKSCGIVVDQLEI